jgi:hypothetical protein
MTKVQTREEVLPADPRGSPELRHLFDFGAVGCPPTPQGALAAAGLTLRIIRSVGAFLLATCASPLRVNENDVGDAIFSTLHEAGHAIYELVSVTLDGTPLGKGVSARRP